MQERRRREIDQLVEQIMRQILEEERAHESSVFSARSYGDEPILRTGADLRRDARRDKAAGTRKPRGRTHLERRAPIAQGENQRPRGPRAARAVAARSVPDPAWQDGWLDGSAASARTPDLPEPLMELRALQGSRKEDGTRLSGADLFVRQARVAADFEPEDGDIHISSYHYYPSYQELNDQELLSYFRWRAQWRHGTATQAPAACVRLVAAELVNGIGAERGPDGLAVLRRLRLDCGRLETLGMGASLQSDLGTWTRDYVVYFGLDPSEALDGEERAFGEAVAILRAAERDTLAHASVRGLQPSDAMADPPSDSAIWEALGAISTYSLQRSPFFREHQEEAAVVGASVFRQLALHCAKRRKTCLMDGLVGFEETRHIHPFLGLPFLEDSEHADVSVRLSPSETMSHRFGRWRLKRAYEHTTRSRDLARLLRGIDRQMRLDWGYKRQLKEVALPKYLRTMITKASTAEHERVEEAERRRIRIDLSQLGRIRAAAATTREALLVDEEREGYLPEGPVTPSRPTTTPQPVASSTPQDNAGSSKASGESGDSATSTAAPSSPKRPLGLGELELTLVRRLLDGTDTSDLFGPGTPPPSVVVDAINERLYDEVGDTVVEFDEDERPHLVEDYAEDVRDLLS